MLGKRMKSACDRIIEELDFLLGSRFFELKKKQKQFLEHFRRVYKERQRIVPVRFQELIDGVFEGNENYSDNVSVHLKHLSANLEAIYKTDEGKGRTGIRLEWIKKGTYQLALTESLHDETLIEHAEGPDQPSAATRGSEISGESGRGCGAGSLCQSVDETILFAKEMDQNGANRIKWIASGILWSSVLVGLPVLILLLIGLPYWPNKPLQGLGFMALLASCTCAGIIAKPLTRLPGVPFGRWCGEIFYVYRQGVLMLARYSGTCVVDGCGGNLSLTGEREAMANLVGVSGQRWVLVCKSVPGEHPRTPFDFTALNRVQVGNVVSEPELARPA